MTETAKLYTVRHDCGDAVHVPYSETARLGATGRNGDGEFTSATPCPACRNRQEAAGIRWTITYETAASGRAHGTPSNGWYPSEAKTLPGGHERIILGDGGQVDWKATSTGLLARWCRLNGSYAGRIRFQGWQGGSTGPAAFQRVVSTRHPS